MTIKEVRSVVYHLIVGPNDSLMRLHPLTLGRNAQPGFSEIPQENIFIQLRAYVLYLTAVKSLHIM